MPAPRFVRPLDAAELAALQERYRTTNDADERSRYQMILFSSYGKTVPEIAELTWFDSDTVLYRMDRYEADGLAGLATKPRPRQAILKRLRTMIRHSNRRLRRRHTKLASLPRPGAVAAWRPIWPSRVTAQ